MYFEWILETRFWDKRFEVDVLQDSNINLVPYLSIFYVHCYNIFQKMIK